MTMVDVEIEYLYLIAGVYFGLLEECYHANSTNLLSSRLL